MDGIINYDKYHAERKLQRRIINSKNFVYQYIIKLIEKYLMPHSKVLDVGCGVGTVSFYLASQGYLVTGIDISRKAIDLARVNSKLLLGKNRPIFKVFDFLKIGLSKNFFDAVIITEVLEHLEDDERAVKIISGSLKKNGVVIASSPSLNAPLFKLGLVGKFDQRVGHLRRYSPKSFKKIFSDNGFKIIKIELKEGLIRNFLFTNSIGEKFIRFIRGPLTPLVTYLDDLTLNLFGESQIYLVARKL